MTIPKIEDVIPQLGISRITSTLGEGDTQIKYEQRIVSGAVPRAIVVYISQFDVDAARSGLKYFLQHSVKPFKLAQEEARSDLQRALRTLEDVFRGYSPKQGASGQIPFAIYHAIISENPQQYREMRRVDNLIGIAIQYAERGDILAAQTALHSAAEMIKPEKPFYQGLLDRVFSIVR